MHFLWSLFCPKEFLSFISMPRVLDKLSECIYVLSHIQRHYFIRSFCLFFKSSKAFSASLNLMFHGKANLEDEKNCFSRQIFCTFSLWLAKDYWYFMNVSFKRSLKLDAKIETSWYRGSAFRDLRKAHYDVKFLNAQQSQNAAINRLENMFLLESYCKMKGYQLEQTGFSKSFD